MYLSVSSHIIDLFLFTHDNSPLALSSFVDHSYYPLAKRSYRYIKPDFLFHLDKMSRLEFETRYIPRGPNSNKYRRGDSFSHAAKRAVSEANPDIRKYVHKMQKQGVEEEWLASPEIPTSQEIMCVKREIDLEENCINLEPNCVDEPWPSVEEYLRTHYELLREDAVALLRDSVAYLRNKPSMTDTKDICIYDQVRKSFQTENYFLFAYFVAGSHYWYDFC
jgi:hypothetical protein